MQRAGSAPTASRSPGRASCPTGAGAVNAAGLDFYDRLVDGLLEAGIEPGDALPLGPAAAAGGPGGWPRARHRRRLRRLRRRRRRGALGDRVQHWITLNEPWCSAFSATRRASTRRASGSRPRRCAVAPRCCWRTARRSRRCAPSAPGAQVGIVLNLDRVAAGSDRAADRAAARRFDGYLQPLVPRPAVRPRLPGRHARALRRAVSTRRRARRRPGARSPRRPTSSASTTTRRRSSSTARRTRCRATGGARAGRGDVTEMGWAVDPTVCDELLRAARRATTRAGRSTITENGAAYRRRVAPTAACHDPERDRTTCDEHLAAAARGDRRGRAAARLLRLVAAGQLRVGLGLHAALRHRARRLRDPAAHRQGQRALVSRLHRARGVAARR